MPALLPDDPIAFVAQAEHATNSRNVDWAMRTYAPSITLETFGDGLHEIHHGADAVRAAVETIYGWFDSIDGRIRKTLVSASGDALVNQWEGSLFGGRISTYGSELWFFDETGRVVHNILYQSLDPKGPTHPLTVLRAAICHPRPALTYLATRTRVRCHLRATDRLR